MSYGRAGRIKAGLAALILFVFASAGAGAEDLEAYFKQVLSTFNEMPPVLKTVKDKASAEAALPKLKAIEEKLKALEDKKADIVRPPEEQARKLEAAYQQSFKKAFADLIREVERIHKIPESFAVLKDTKTLKEAKEAMFHAANPDVINKELALRGVNTLALALEAYKLDGGKYPEKLDALTMKRIVAKGALVDPWNRPYLYDAAGPKHKGERPDVWSQGPDPKKADGVIGNWQK